MPARNSAGRRPPRDGLTRYEGGGALALYVLLFAAWAIRSEAAAVANPAAARLDDRLNILLIIADDWGWPHAGACGDPVVRTPHFDRLAREGTLFQHAYVSSPSCTPSRGALLTGQWHWRLESGANLWSVFPDKFRTYPDILADQGYTCGTTGKAWGPGRTESPTRRPAGQPAKDFRTFLEGRTKDRPFCFWLGSTDPHRPYDPGTGRASGLDLSRIPVPGCFPDTPSVREDIADYYFEVARFDALVGDAVAALEAAGELDRTVIVVTGDHGMPFPRGKGNLYDTGVRVPLVIRWPGAPAGRVVDSLVSLIDLAPTFLEIGGLPPAADMNGQSLLPLFAAAKSDSAASQPAAPSRDFVLFGKERHQPCQEAPDMGGYPCRGIRTHDFLYIRNFRPDRWPNGTPNYREAAIPGSWLADCDNGPAKTWIVEQQDRDERHRRCYDLAFAKRPAEELYDLRTDPGQFVNVAGEAAYAETRAELARRLMAELTATGDPRVTGVGVEVFETHPYLGGFVQHPLWRPDTALLWPFEADVTPPLGHRLLTGHRRPMEGVDDPLFAKGFVLAPGGAPPLVYCAVDWAEIRNDAYDRWRDALAEAAGTSRDRVLVSCIHQHDAPLADLAAQRLLSDAGADGQIIDPVFHEQAVQGVAAALRAARDQARPVTHIGFGKARAEQLASNRRYLRPDGTVSYGRYSAGGTDESQQAGDGDIDPFVHAVSFWSGQEPLAVLSAYATHPMSYYGTGRASADFPGRARSRRQAATPGALQIYASGASGNVTVGKYNDGRPEQRPILAERLERAMEQAFEATERWPFERAAFRVAALMLAPRDGPRFNAEDLSRRLADASRPADQELAALGLSWSRRCDAGQPVDVPCIDLGRVQIVLLPAEVYVEYQLAAQALRPDAHVVVIGYGECAPGYIPIERAWTEGDENLGAWCWAAPGAEPKMMSALSTLLRGRSEDAADALGPLPAARVAADGALHAGRP